MSKKSLSAKFVETVKAAPAGGRHEYWDARLPGFGLRVTDRGRKTFFVMYRAHGQQRRLTLGHHPALSLASAREAAAAALRLVEQGLDPRAARDERSRQEAADLSNTVASALQVYFDSYLPFRPRNRTWRETKQMLERELMKRWGGRPMASINRVDVINLRNDKRSDGARIAAEHLLGQVRLFFDWAVDNHKAASNPAADIKAIARATDRDRYLNDDEVRAFWSATRLMGYPFGPLFQLLLATGLRENEVAGLQRRDVNPDRDNAGKDALWTVPRERMKNDQAHIVPLSTLALELLDNLPKLNSEYFFTTTGRSPVSGFSKAKLRLDALMLAELRELSAARGEDTARVDLPHWVLHDLRRTMTSNLSQLGVPEDLSDRLLSHKRKGRGRGVIGIYNRYSYLKERRQALSTWARRLMDIIEPQSSNVVLLRSAAGAAAAPAMAP